MIKKIAYKGEKSVIPTWLMFADILVALSDKDENISTADDSHSVGWKLTFSSVSFKTTRMSTDMSQVGVALFSP